MAKALKRGKTMNQLYPFSSESVSAGHPDKVCDQISDAILSECLLQDPASRVAIEASIKDHTLFLFGEITSRARINAPEIAKDTRTAPSATIGLQVSDI
jgi:S-adenosylmethionine synthetase